MRPFRRKVCLGVVMAVLALPVAGVATVVIMLKVHDQDVRVYSVTPGGKVQVIGLRHRCYVLEWGGGKTWAQHQKTSRQRQSKTRRGRS